MVVAKQKLLMLTILNFKSVQLLSLRRKIWQLFILYHNHNFTS